MTVLDVRSPDAGTCIPRFRSMETWSHEIDLYDLLARYGSPLYLHHPDTLWRNFQDYLDLVHSPGDVRYPVKANPSPLVLDALARWGAGADCASRPEVRAALSAGIPVARVSYNTPALDVRLASWLLREGGTVVADSVQALDELRQVMSGEAPPAGRLFVRINPGALPGYAHELALHRYTDHGARDSQFGIPSEEVLDLLRGYPLMVSGLHLHVGTMMDNVECFVAALEFLHTLLELLVAETMHPLNAINLGGGLGLPYGPRQEIPTIGSLAEALRPHMRHDVTYEVEPGNSLVGDAFALLARVVALKQARGRRWGIVDVGTDQLVKHTVARWEHQIVDAAGTPLPGEGPDALGGPLCFAGDVLLPTTDLGGVRQGDPLLIRHAGAYCEAIASRFNGRIGPAHVVVGDDGRLHLARRREDPFFDTTLQTYRPIGFSKAPDDGVRVDPATTAALQSEYMHTLATQDAYDIGEVRKVDERTYLFTVEPRAAVGFVAMPLALRILGDASITAVGLELGWSEKKAPVWATRLTLTAGTTIPARGTLPCRVAVSALTPGTRPGVAAAGHVHFELGEDAEFRGTAKISVPAGE